MLLLPDKTFSSSYLLIFFSYRQSVSKEEFISPNI